MSEQEHYRLTLAQVVTEVRYLSFLWWDRRGRITQKVRSDFDSLAIPATVITGPGDLQAPIVFQEPSLGIEASAAFNRLVFTQAVDRLDVSAYGSRATRFLRTILEDLDHTDPIGRVGVRFFYRISIEREISTFIIGRLPGGIGNLSAGVAGMQYLTRLQKQDQENGNYIISLYAGMPDALDLLAGSQSTPVIDLDFYQEQLKNLRNLYDIILMGYALAERELPRLLGDVFS